MLLPEIILYGIIDLAEHAKHFTEGGDRTIEIQLTPVGTVFVDGVKLNVTDEMNQAAADYFERSPATEITTDYNHGTSKQHATAEEGKSSGWMRSVVNRAGRGLFAIWKATKKAADYVDKKEYRYFSPSLVFNRTDKYTGNLLPMRVRAGGLTNVPFFEGMKPIEFSDLADGPMRFFAADDPTSITDNNFNEPKGNKNMDPKTIARLIKAGLLAKDFSDTATEEEVAAGLEEKKETDDKDAADKLKKAEDEKKAAEAKGKGDADPKTEPTGEAKELKTQLDAADVQIDKVTKDFADFKEKTQSKDREDILAQAIKDGKIAADKGTTDYWDGRLKADFDDTAAHIQNTMRKNQYTKTDGAIGSDDTENAPASFFDACDLQRAEFKKAGNTDFSEDDVINAVQEKYPTLYEADFSEVAG